MTKTQPENGDEKDSKNKSDVDETPDTLNLIELKCFIIYQSKYLSIMN